MLFNGLSFRLPTVCRSGGELFPCRFRRLLLLRRLHYGQFRLLAGRKFVENIKHRGSRSFLRLLFCRLFSAFFCGFLLKHCLELLRFFRGGPFCCPRRCGLLQRDFNFLALRLGLFFGELFFDRERQLLCAFLRVAGLLAAQAGELIKHVLHRAAHLAGAGVGLFILGRLHGDRLRVNGGILEVLPEIVQDLLDGLTILYRSLLLVIAVIDILRDLLRLRVDRLVLSVVVGDRIADIALTVGIAAAVTPQAAEKRGKEAPLLRAALLARLLRELFLRLADVLLVITGALLRGLVGIKGGVGQGLLPGSRLCARTAARTVDAHILVLFHGKLRRCRRPRLCGIRTLRFPAADGGLQPLGEDIQFSVFFCGIVLHIFKPLFWVSIRCPASALFTGCAGAGSHTS